MITDAERTMREENWIPSAELLDGDLPDVLVAFLTLDRANEAAWDRFKEEITDNKGLIYYGRDQGEFSSSPTWESLCEDWMGAPFEDRFAIRAGMSKAAHEACRAMRNLVRSSELEGEQNDSDDYFFSLPARWRLLPAQPIVVVYHDNNDMSPFFDETDRSEAYSGMGNLLRGLGLERSKLRDGNVTIIRKIKTPTKQED